MEWASFGGKSNVGTEDRELLSARVEKKKPNNERGRKERTMEERRLRKESRGANSRRPGSRPRTKTPANRGALGEGARGVCKENATIFDAIILRIKREERERGRRSSRAKTRTLWEPGNPTRRSLFYANRRFCQSPTRGAASLDSPNWGSRLRIIGTSSILLARSRPENDRNRCSDGSI